MVSSCTYVSEVPTNGPASVCPSGRRVHVPQSLCTLKVSERVHLLKLALDRADCGVVSVMTMLRQMAVGVFLFRLRTARLYALRPSDDFVHQGSWEDRRDLRRGFRYLFA